MVVVVVVSKYETGRKLKSSMQEIPEKLIHLGTPKSMKLSYLIG